MSLFHYSWFRRIYKELKDYDHSVENNIFTLNNAHHKYFGGEELEMLKRTNTLYRCGTRIALIDLDVNVSGLDIHW